LPTPTIRFVRRCVASGAFVVFATFGAPGAALADWGQSDWGTLVWGFTLPAVPVLGPAGPALLATLIALAGSWLAGRRLRGRGGGE
jgi:hypothetical protein